MNNIRFNAVFLLMMRTLIIAVVLVGLVVNSLAQTSSVPPPSPDIVKARDLLNRNHADEAITILEQLASQQPPVKGVQHDLGLAYYRTSKLAKAQDAFAAAIREDASDMESVQMEGLVLYRLNKQSEAIPYLERVRQWMPNANADANYVLGLCYLKSQRYDDARHSFATQYGEAPDSPEAYLLLSKMLMQLSQQDVALVQVQKALQLSPKLPLAHFLQGEIALSKGNLDEAITKLEEERSINPAYAPVYDRLADAYTRADKWAEAQQALAKGISLDRSSTAPFILMGKVLLHFEDTQTAIMYLRHAEKMDPGNFLTHSYLAQAYHRAGLDDEAKHENEMASKLNAASQPKMDLAN